jgi:hypothetical protein
LHITLDRASQVQDIVLVAATIGVGGANDV